MLRVQLVVVVPLQFVTMVNVVMIVHNKLSMKVFVQVLVLLVKYFV